MSDTRIKDGGHEGTFARVSSDGQLSTQSSVMSEFADISERKRLSYEFHPSSFSVGTAYIPVFYMKNISSDKNFHIEYVRWGWNGGSTNWNRTASFRMYNGMTAPTTDVVTGKFGVGDGSHNLHLGAAISPEMEVIFWDKAGTDGMTIADVPMTTTELGNQINCGQIGQGATFFQYGGALILPPSATLGFGMKGDEAGSVIVVVAGFFKDIQ